jgi:hypothetical protein
MNNIFQDIISLFSSIQINTTDIEEKYSEVKISVACSDGKTPSTNDFIHVLSMLNARDSLHISIIQNEEPVANYDTSKNGNFDTYIATCSDCLKSNSFTIVLTITKNNVEQKISVYYPERFFEYLSNLSFNFFLEVINNTFNGNSSIIFEIQDETAEKFSTESIKFVPINSSAKTNGISFRTERINKIKNLCHCSIVTKYPFIPEDFYPITESESPSLNNLFKRVTLLYSSMFLFDIFDVDNQNNISYKLNGYKTINWQINHSDVDISSFDEYYKIYQWTYDGGNIVDKIGLVRNILSLNFEKKSLKLSETTFEAVKSSYRVYQKENIKQYIEIRNKISDQLVELQNKADKIVDGFVGDYKKSLLAVVSFFASVIVIKVVSSGDFSGAFTPEVTALSVGFIVISFFLMLFSRWEIKKQLSRYENFYSNLKIRYTDLLEASDINRILNNDTDFNDNRDFIKERRRKYTILWIISLFILLVIVVILFFKNQPCTIAEGVCKIIQKIILCFTKNT